MYCFLNTLVHQILFTNASISWSKICAWLSVCVICNKLLNNDLFCWFKVFELTPTNIDNNWHYCTNCFSNSLINSLIWVWFFETNSDLTKPLNNLNKCSSWIMLRKNTCFSNSGVITCVPGAWFLSKSSSSKIHVESH